MWEIALLIVSLAFLALVIFTLPILFQLFHAARELELTLREARLTLERVRVISEKAETAVDQGTQVIQGAGRALAAIDGILGKNGTRYAAKIITTALEVMPVVLAAKKLFTNLKRRKDHV
jgi:hypothetical protein